MHYKVVTFCRCFFSRFLLNTTIVMINIDILIENNFFGNLLRQNDRKQITKKREMFRSWSNFIGIFPTLPLPSQQQLLLAEAGRTQQIRLEKTYTPMIMKPARKVICDSQFLTFFKLIQGFIVEIYTLWRNTSR